MSETIPLRDVVASLREEILAAVDAATTETLQFELGQLELEFQVVAKTEKGVDGKVGGKVSFHIFSVEASVGGSGKLSDERTQKIKFILTPTQVDPKSGKKNRSVRVGRRNRPAR